MPKRRFLKLDDTFWVWLERAESSMHVGGLAIFRPDAPASEAAGDVVRGFRGHADVTGRFNQVVTPRSFPFRSTKHGAADVDIDYHLRHLALPRPGGERELGTMVSRLHSMPVDFRRPAWEANVIEGLSDNRFAIYTKTHHALVNGVVAVGLQARSMSTSPTEPLKAPIWALERNRRIGEARQPTKLRERLAALLGTLRGFLQFLGIRRPENMVGPFSAPRSVLNRTTSPQRRVSTMSIDLDRMKGIGKRAGASLNDAVLAACSTAIRRYLLELGELPEKPLVTGVPVSIPAPEGSSADSTISMMLVELATDEPDPLERLRRIAVSSAAAKEHFQSMPAESRAHYSALMMLPHVLRQVTPVARRATPPVFNLVISNVPGPQQPLYLGGSRLDAFYPFSLLFNGEALNITVLSYDGRLHFGFTACRTALPHVQKLALYLADAVDELEKATQPSIT
jgi:diacylglycerol O-acyltransferase